MGSDKGQAMMNRLHRLNKITQILLLATCYLLLATFAFADTVSSTELINNARQYDGKLIAYQGEAIGDIMKRGEYAWVNVHDGKNAIGVWAKKDLVSNITFTGSYKFKGDIIEVEGIFNRSCAMHGGDLDIHAEGIKIVQQGTHLYEAVNLGKQRWAVGLGIILLLIFFLTLFKR